MELTQILREAGTIGSIEDPAQSCLPLCLHTIKAADWFHQTIISSPLSPASGPLTVQSPGHMTFQCLSTETVSAGKKPNSIKGREREREREGLVYLSAPEHACFIGLTNLSVCVCGKVCLHEINEIQVSAGELVCVCAWACK